MRDPSLAVACGAGVPQLSGPAALWTGQVEAHRPGHLRYRSGPVALRARGGLAARRAASAAGLAHVVARDAQARLGALDRLPKIDVETVFQVGALLGFGLRRRATVEKLRENVAETAA